jgi:hypothetical protein
MHAIVGAALFQLHDPSGLFVGSPGSAELQLGSPAPWAELELGAARGNRLAKLDSLFQSHLEFRLLGRKADAEILTTDHTDYTDRGRFGFLCIRAIGVIRG